MSQRILLILADAAQAHAVRSSLLALRDANFQVEWVQSCAEGERRLGVGARQAAEGITSILTDLYFPDSQGIDTVDRLLRAAPHVPILVLCSPQHEAVARLAIQRGAHDYLLKNTLNGEMLAKSLGSMSGRAASFGALFEEKERARMMLKSIGDAIISVDARGNVTYLNVIAESLTGWSCGEAIGRPIEQVIRIINGTTREPVPDPLAATILAGSAVALPSNSFCVRRDGVEIAIEDSTALIHDRHGQLAGAVMVFRDVSAARAQSQQLTHQAHHDGLTGLPNNTLFSDRLTQAMALANRRGNKLAVLFVDMDYFKHVNDSLGHINGDLLLQSVAARLLTCVRNTDTVSRRGGDEFVILLSEVAQAEDAGLCAEKILAALNAAHCVGQNTVQVSASVGIATYPEDGTDPETLLRNADFAMYHAKESGRNCYRFCVPALNMLAAGRQAV